MTLARFLFTSSLVTSSAYVAAQSEPEPARLIQVDGPHETADVETSLHTLASSLAPCLRGEEHEERVRVRIGRDGRVQDVEPLEEEGDEDAERLSGPARACAVRVLRQARFPAASRGSVAVLVLNEGEMTRVGIMATLDEQETTVLLGALRSGGSGGALVGRIGVLGSGTGGGTLGTTMAPPPTMQAPTRGSRYHVTSVQGPLPSLRITRRLRVSQRLLDRCHERAENRAPRPGPRVGVIRLQVSVRAEGTADRVQVDQNTTGDAELAQCVLRHVRRWRFRPQPSGTRFVLYAAWR